MRIPLGKFDLLFIRSPRRKYTPNDLVTVRYTKKQLHKKVVGAIRDACHCHPEIPKKFIGSIAKRICNTVFGTTGIPDYMIQESDQP